MARIMMVVAAVWLGLVGAATAGWFGNSVLTNRLSGNFLLPLVLMFIARTISRRTMTGEGGTESEGETVTDLQTTTETVERVEPASSATFKRRTPPSGPREPKPASTEDMLKATGVASSSEAERIRPPVSKPKKAESRRPKTSAEMVEDAKKKFTSGA